MAEIYSKLEVYSKNIRKKFHDRGEYKKLENAVEVCYGKTYVKVTGLMLSSPSKYLVIILCDSELCFTNKFIGK